MRFPVRIAREKPASGSHGVPLRHCVRVPATRTAYGGGKLSTWWLRSPDAVRKGGVRYSSPQSPGMGVSLAMASVSSTRSCSVERELEQLHRVVDVVALAEPGADDHAADRGVFEHPAAGDVGDGDAVLLRDACGRREHCPGTAAQPPAARMKRPYFMRDQVPVFSQSGSGWPSQRSVSHPPATVP